MKSKSVQIPMGAQQFTQLFSATRRGARLARLLTVEQLVVWGWPRDGETAHAAALVVAELASNAVRHGRLEGRSFRITLVRLPCGALRVEVTDPRGERLPARRAGGFGLALVEALASDWGVRPYAPSGKTVWAEIVPGRPQWRIRDPDVLEAMPLQLHRADDVAPSPAGPSPVRSRPAGPR
ncbi:ATP-binding protein [Streptomyces sp. NPDC102441]|uniref:ATP-binding protein n=1 Tax=Streptomyces sp. NPDC102441 TaxID=3366176 RepID=UPI00380F82AE